MKTICLDCGGGLVAGYNDLWQHADHEDWRVRPHDPIPATEECKRKEGHRGHL